jgi:hypothetical protein
MWQAQPHRLSLRRRRGRGIQRLKDKLELGETRSIGAIHRTDKRDRIVMLSKQRGGRTANGQGQATQPCAARRGFPRSYFMMTV